MTLRRVVTTRRADQDIDDAITYYVDAGARDAALGFVDALEKAKDLLEEHPSIGSARFATETDIPDLRGVPLQRYPYIAFCTDDSDAVRVHRVLHTSRDMPTELMEP